MLYIGRIDQLGALDRFYEECRSLVPTLLERLDANRGPGASPVPLREDYVAGAVLEPDVGGDRRGRPAPGLPSRLARPRRHADDGGSR